MSIESKTGEKTNVSLKWTWVGLGGQHFAMDCLQNPGELSTTTNAIGHLKAKILINQTPGFEEILVVEEKPNLCPI